MSTGPRTTPSATTTPSRPSTPTAIDTGLLAGTTAGGAILAAVAGHAAAGISRKDLKEAGEQLDEGTAALVVVGASDTASKIEHAIGKAEKVEQKQLKADQEAIGRNAHGA